MERGLKCLSLYLIIFGIVVITTILCLVQWGYLMSLSSKIKEIEQEIEKKAQEFDTIRKNRIAEARPAPQTEKNDFQDFNTPSESPESNMTCSPIQVIRPTDDTGDNDIIAVQPGIAEAPAPISNDEAAGGLEDPEGSIQIMKNVNGKFTDTSIFRIKSRKMRHRNLYRKTTKIKEKASLQLNILIRMTILSPRYPMTKNRNPFRW
jgi:hypothetical protein